MKKMILAASIVMAATACTSIKLAIPTQFSSGATEMPVKGLNGWMINQKLTFGSFATTSIKKGWNVTSTKADKVSNVGTEERLLKVFKVNQQNNTINQRNKYQYSISDGTISTEIFCMEKMSTEELVVKTNNPILGDFTKTKNSQYSFSAAILPQSVYNDEPWQMIMYSIYDAAKDTAKRFWDVPYKEEEGYATNGKETIVIRPLRIQTIVNKKGKEANFPVKIPTGYELRMDDGVVGIIDDFGKSIWIYNDLDAKTKLILASISSAIMLKKISE